MFRFFFFGFFFVLFLTRFPIFLTILWCQQRVFICFQNRLLARLHKTTTNMAISGITAIMLHTSILFIYKIYMYNLLWQVLQLSLTGACNTFALTTAAVIAVCVCVSD